MTIKMEYETERFKETIEYDYRINQLILTQKDKDRDIEIQVVSIFSEQIKDLYELLKEVYE